MIFKACGWHLLSSPMNILRKVSSFKPGFVSARASPLPSLTCQGFRSYTWSLYMQRCKHVYHVLFSGQFCFLGWMSILKTESVSFCSCYTSTISTLPANVREAVITLCLTWSSRFACLGPGADWLERTRLPLIQAKWWLWPGWMTFPAWLSRVNASGLCQQAETVGDFSKRLFI